MRLSKTVRKSIIRECISRHIRRRRIKQCNFDITIPDIPINWSDFDNTILDNTSELVRKRLDKHLMDIEI